MGNKNEFPTVPALKKRRCRPIHQRDKDRMGRPCMAANGNMLKGTLNYMTRGKRPRERPQKRW